MHWSILQNCPFQEQFVPQKTPFLNLPHCLCLLLVIHLPTTTNTTLENQVLNFKYTPFSRGVLDVQNGVIELKVSLNITALACPVKYSGFYTQYHQATVIDIMLIISNVI